MQENDFKTSSNLFSSFFFVDLWIGNISKHKPSRKHDGYKSIGKDGRTDVSDRLLGPGVEHAQYSVCMKAWISSPVPHEQVVAAHL